jgi:hypothetical protein
MGRKYLIRSPIFQAASMADRAGRIAHRPQVFQRTAYFASDALRILSRGLSVSPGATFRPAGSF